MEKIYPSIKRSLDDKNHNFFLLSLGILLLFISAWLIFVYLEYYQSRFFPRTYVDDINISGLTKEEARIKIEANLENKIDFRNDDFTLFYQDQKVQAKLEQLAISNNIEETLNQALAKHQQVNLLKKIKQIVQSHFYPNRYFLRLNFEPSRIQVLIDELKKKVDLEGEEPKITVNWGKIEVSTGKTSNNLSVDETWQILQHQIFDRNLRELDQADLKVEAVVTHQILALNPLQITASQNRAEKLLGQKLVLRYDYQKTELTDQKLIDFLKLPTGLNSEKIENLIKDLKAQIDRPSSDALFQYDHETLAVTEFVPDKDGLVVDALATKNLIENFLANIEKNNQAENKITTELDLPMTTVKAQFTLEKSNDLGIKEVIGFGESWYDHSIPNRIDNVDLTTSRITKHIIKPGEEFSFNKTLGEVSDRTGYKNAYVIEAGQTKLAPGGGVCQVSSTLFRSLLDAGVKISKRLPHAYRVSYYEIGNEPGFDATVYAGEVDLRFINDTPGHILIDCQSNREKLYMTCKLYGTSDGRSTEISKYKKWNAVGALPTIYIPDPSLKPGQLKQIDWAAGGIKTEFTNVIKNKNGEIVREDYYYSNYRPWAAKYLRGI